MDIRPAEKLGFASDYMEGAHPEILKRLYETNFIKSSGYGTDEFSESARDRIRIACDAPGADVWFLTGGTQTNAVVISALLRSYQGVIAADTGHICGHEAGAIELGGHKVLPLPNRNGKISAEQIAAFVTAWWQDDNREHTVMPGMVYISQPTEQGTLYSLEELESISAVCREGDMPLYLDGARLAYALASPENDVSLQDIARLCDVFYIGGTKCGALFGEAVVMPRFGFVPGFFSIIKQHGALLAKGRIAGIQFDTLFTDDLYFKLGENAVRAAGKIRSALKDRNYELVYENSTNQIFVVLSKEKAEELSEKVELGFWENLDDDRCVMRIATSWATTDDDVEKLAALL